MDYINFLCKSLGTTLHTNVVTADGYETNNLLKDETISTSNYPSALSMINPRNNGFMAEYFVKPPVDIVVQFPCLVDIDCLVVNCRSGSKKVSQLDVSTSCSKPCSEGTDDNNRCEDIKLDSKRLSDSFENLKNYPLQYIPDISSTEIRKQNISSLNMVGRYNAKYFKNDLVIFKNPRNSRGKGNEYHTKGMGTMNFFSLKYLYGASHLIVRVLRTEGSTVVAVKRLEVWGKPFRMNSKFIQDHVYSLCNRNHKQTKDAECATGNDLITSSQKKISNEQEQCASTTTSNLKCKVDKRDSDAIPEVFLDKKNLGAIPEEFLDKITFDAMVLPMLLPSGHTIDNTTLEKCIAQDRMNGRPPSDPFTGVPFTENNNPVPNTSLKARLDKYLLENSGRIPTVSKPVGNTIGTKECEGGTIDRVKGMKRKAVFCGNIESINKKAKEKRDNVQCHVETRIQREDSDDKSQKKNSKWSGAKRNSSEHVCHEDTLKESLETALNAVSKVSMIRKANCIKDSLQPFCCFCKEVNNDAGFFKMPCNHVICRKCINADKAAKKCSKCFMPFNNHDLERVHFNAYFNR